MATVNVNSITINSTSGNAGHGPFGGNGNILSVDLQNVPWTLNSMAEAFYGCSNLSLVTNINPNITNMYRVFSGCWRNLENAPTIPMGVTNMFEAFQDCYNLVNAPTIPNSVIDMYACFRNCRSLIDAPEISGSVTNLSHIFWGCNNLVNAPSMIPNSVINMQYTFYGCHNLQTPPVIGTSVTNMLQSFTACSNLQGNIYIYSKYVDSARQCFLYANALLQKNVYIPFYDGGHYSRTYNAFIDAGYDTVGTHNGVWLRDIATL